MKVQLASVAARAGAGPAQQLLEHYVARIRSYMTIDETVFRSEAALLASFRRLKGPAVSVLMDPRGLQMPSRQFAGMLEGYKSSATQVLLFAVGPADGWSEEARAGADRLLSFGPMTFPHELARVMVAEQVYRACTILAGHPYHSGH